MYFINLNNFLCKNTIFENQFLSSACFSNSDFVISGKKRNNSSRSLVTREKVVRTNVTRPSFSGFGLNSKCNLEQKLMPLKIRFGFKTFPANLTSKRG